MSLVDRYLELGLRLGRHVDGLVDAYYGPRDLARRIDAEAVTPAAALRDDARRLVADLDVTGGHVEDEFLRLIDLVKRTREDDRERVRQHLLELFSVVGLSDPRVSLARRSLAAALF